MTNPLTPREHADIRDLLLAGSERMNPNRFGRALVPAAVAVVLIGGIVGVAVATTLDAGPARIAATPAPTSSFNVEPESQIPALCIEYAGSDAPNAPGGDAIAAAALSADLNPVAVLSPGIQVVESSSNPGTFEATAQVCGDSINRQELITAATSIGKAIHTDPASAGLSVLTVSAWRPISSDAISQDETLAPVSTIYQTHDWDADPENLLTAWE